MPTTHADTLIGQARRGEKLTASQRRHCVSYMMATEYADISPVQMAELFQVSDRTIREDKIHIRQQAAEHIKEEDIGLVIADIRMTLEHQIRDIERSKRKCPLGSRTYLEHCSKIATLQMAAVKALQDLGYYPRNLGTMTTKKYEYKAYVDEGTGAVDTRSVAEFEVIEDAEFEEQKQLPAPEKD
jgi:hypothetical protein